MDKHHGQIIEYIVRKNGYSISDLARNTHVNRRSIYNWFNQKHLKADIIFNIGCVLRHDFSQEFPELFVSDDFKVISKVGQIHLPQVNTTHSENEFYKDKYLSLLERYNDLLVEIQ
ncbi:MAG: helix-turn-helix transcriptional regulator [Mucilaginibacter sp.]|jgi:lambda repressor-like predicted transcriptional regulator|nr:helix-turn-helix transcriptional regulator [Mucilaginibacter sp.]